MRIVSDTSSLRYWSDTILTFDVRKNILVALASDEYIGPYLASEGETVSDSSSGLSFYHIGRTNPWFYYSKISKSSSYSSEFDLYHDSLGHLFCIATYVTFARKYKLMLQLFPVREGAYDNLPDNIKNIWINSSNFYAIKNEYVWVFLGYLSD